MTYTGKLNISQGNIPTLVSFGNYQPPLNPNLPPIKPILLPVLNDTFHEILGILGQFLPGLNASGSSSKTSRGGANLSALERKILFDLPR